MNPFVWIVRLIPGRQRLLWEACASITCARIAVIVLPFGWIAHRLGTARGQSCRSLTAVHTRHARSVAWALARAGRLSPWLGKCLGQAIAGKAMLARRGVPSTLYLGVRRQTHGLEAHAWLRCGTLVLTGDEHRQDFTVVMTIGDQPASQSDSPVPME